MTVSFGAYVIEMKDVTHGGGWVSALKFVDPKKTHAQVARLLEGTTCKSEFRVFAENLQGRFKPVMAKNQFGRFRSIRQALLQVLR